MYLVNVKVIVGLPSTIRLKLLCGDVIEVDEWTVHLLCYSKDGWCEVLELALYPCGVGWLVGVAWSERKEYRYSPLSTNLIDKTTCLSTKSIYHLILFSHLVVYLD